MSLSSRASAGAGVYLGVVFDSARDFVYLLYFLVNVLNISVSSSSASYMGEADRPKEGNLTRLQNYSFCLVETSKIRTMVFCTFIYFKSQAHAVTE
jgi:hypothetical protein